MTNLKFILLGGIMIMVAQAYSLKTFAEEQTAPQPWETPSVSDEIKKNTLFLAVADEQIKILPIQDMGEELIDLDKENNPRLIPLYTFDKQYKNRYPEYSQTRQGVYQALLKMLEILPETIGIAYYESFRTLHQQKKYFDDKFKETLAEIPDKDLAYLKTSLSVSPFIDNIPTHTTGAAIDMTLFEIKGKKAELIDMGKIDTIFGPNDQQETFSPNTSSAQRENRLILLNAAIKAGLVNYGHEWWHYSYGDKVWAYVKGKKAALYGMAADMNDPILSIQKEAYFNEF